MNAFARRVLRVCRGNLEDVEQGHIFENFMQQHGIREDDFDSTLGERMRVQAPDYDWLNQLLGADYASSMVEAPLYRPPFAQLSQHGVWEHGEGSNAAAQGGVFEQGGPSSQYPTSQVENPTQTEVPQVDRRGRVIRPREAYTPSEYVNRRGRGRGTNGGQGEA